MLRGQPRRGRSRCPCEDYRLRTGVPRAGLANAVQAWHRRAGRCACWRIGRRRSRRWRRRGRAGGRRCERGRGRRCGRGHGGGRRRAARAWRLGVRLRWRRSRRPVAHHQGEPQSPRNRSRGRRRSRCRNDGVQRSQPRRRHGCWRCRYRQVRPGLAIAAASRPWHDGGGLLDQARRLPEAVGKADDRRKKSREDGSREHEGGQGEAVKMAPRRRTQRWSGSRTQRRSESRTQRRSESRTREMAISHNRFGRLPRPPADGAGALHRSRLGHHPHRYGVVTGHGRLANFPAASIIARSSWGVNIARGARLAGICRGTACRAPTSSRCPTRIP
jgi:hypothetical protein